MKERRLQERRALLDRGQREHVFMPAGEGGQQAEMGHSQNQGWENIVKSPGGITSHSSRSHPPKKQSCSHVATCAQCSSQGQFRWSHPP